MATLFECSTDNIGLYLKNIFESGELDKSSVTGESAAAATDGKFLEKALNNFGYNAFISFSSCLI